MSPALTRDTRVFGVPPPAYPDEPLPPKPLIRTAAGAEILPILLQCIVRTE